MGGCASSSPKEKKVIPSVSYLSVEDSVKYRGENLKSSFPIYGVHLSYLTEFVSYGTDLLKNKPTSSVVNIIKDLTSDHKTSLIEFLVEQDNPSVGIAEIYICHCWKMKFTDLVEILQDFFEGKDPIIWLDIFSINQHVPLTITSEWLLEVMKPIIGRIHHTVMVFPFWKKFSADYSTAPLPLGRSWCLWELYCTLETGSRLQIAMTKSQKRQFLSDFLDIKDDIYLDDGAGSDADAEGPNEAVLALRSDDLEEMNHEGNHVENDPINESQTDDHTSRENQEEMIVQEFVKLLPEFEDTVYSKEHRSLSDEVTFNINASLDSVTSGGYGFPLSNSSLHHPRHSFHRSTSNQRQEASLSNLFEGDERYRSRSTSGPRSRATSGARSRSKSDSIIHRSLTMIEIEKSLTTKVEEKTILYETISNSVGFAVFNNMISRGLRDWLIKLTARESDKEKDSLRKLLFQEHLVFLYLQQGRYEKAERIAREIVNLRILKQGQDHPDTIKSSKHLEMVTCKSPLIHQHNTRSVVREVAAERVIGAHG
jgi:hypothetical protein